MEIFIEGHGRMGSNMAEGSTFGRMAVFIRETTWMAIDKEKGTCRAAYVMFFGII
jgi:hypothetical protein